MARIQYQQSQGKGWSNIDPGYISLSRMREKQKEDEQGKDRYLQEVKNKNAQDEADQVRINKAVEANLKEINIESKVSSTQEAALRVNKGIAEQNFKAETERNKVKSTLDTLIELAPSAFEAKQKMDDADWDATAKAATAYYSTHGLEEARKFRTDLLEDDAFFGGQRIEFRADEMAKSGYSTEQVMFVRHKNSAVDYALRKALAIDAGNNYKATLQSALLKAGLKDPAEQTAFIDDFNVRYLQGHGLYTTEDGQQISADFLGPVYEKMSNARSDIVGRARLQKALTDSQEHTNKYVETAKVAIRSESEDLTIAVNATNTALERIKNTPKDIYGNYPTDAEARDTVLEFVVDANKPAYAQKVLKEIPYTAGGQDSNMWDANLPQINRLLDQKAKDAEIAKGIQAKVDLAGQTAELDNFEKETKAPGFNITKEALDEKFNEWYDKGYSPAVIQDRFWHLTDWTTKGKWDGNPILKNVYDKINDHTVTVEDVTDPNLPPNSFSPQEIAEVAKNQQLLKIANYEDNYEEDIGNALHNILAEEAVVKKGQKMDISLKAAKKGAKKMFSKCIIGGGDKDFCHKQLTDEIAKPDGLFKKGEYSSEDKRKRLPGQPETYFVNFTFDEEQKSKLSANHFPLNTTEKVNLVMESIDDESIKTTLFIPPDNFKAVEERIQRGLPYDYHEIAIRKSLEDPDKYPTPMHFYKEQAYLAKDAGLLDNDETFNFETLKGAWIDKTEEPTVRRKISTAQTNQELQKALELSSNPGAARDPMNMSIRSAMFLNKVQERQEAIEAGLIDPTSDDFPLFGLEEDTYTQEFNLTA